MKLLATVIAGAALTTACTAGQHRAEVRDDTAERVTVGTVQREIRIGMSAADVASTLGAPNIVSTDAERQEVWIYDRFATDVVYSDSDGGVLGVIFGPLGSGGAAAVGAGSRSAGARSTSQRTLTVIIHFDGDNRVDDFAYHTSRF